MPARRMLSLGLVLIAALPWSVALTALGLRAMLATPGAGPFSGGWFGTGAGLAAFGAGQLVFMVCVSDRVFPRADRRLTASAECAMAVLFVVGLVAASCGLVLDGGTA